MPHFTLANDPNGGPIITAAVTVSSPRAAALIQAGQAPPQVQIVRALLDTGASMTCIDPLVLQTLALSPSGSIDCHTPSTGAVPAKKDVYDVGLHIYATATQPGLSFATLPVLASDLYAAQGIHALVGRDVLGSCLLAYNGQTGTFTLAF